jgi:hypothetical protein
MALASESASHIPSCVHYARQTVCFISRITWSRRGHHFRKTSTSTWSYYAKLVHTGDSNSWTPDQKLSSLTKGLSSRLLVLVFAGFSTVELFNINARELQKLAYTVYKYICDCRDFFKKPYYSIVCDNLKKKWGTSALIKKEKNSSYISKSGSSCRVIYD